MTTSDVAQILAALARVETEVKNLRRDDDNAAARMTKAEGRLDKLDRIAYTALGVAVASGLPELVSLIR